MGLYEYGRSSPVVNVDATGKIAVAAPRVWAGCADNCFCFQLLNNLNQNSFNRFRACMGSTASTWATGAGQCFVGCALLLFIPGAFQICMAACEGGLALIEI